MDTRSSAFIKKAILKHGNEFDYSEVLYINSKTKINIICKKHGIFKQSTNNHLSGQKCPKCYGNSKLDTQLFINKSNIIHNKKYDYSLVDYKNNKTKVKIICSEHGIFYQLPNKHLLRQGCPKCDSTRKLTSVEFVKKSNIVHNEKYDYSLIDYKNNKSLLDIICREHGIFKQIAKNHLLGYGCQKCAGNKKLSTNEFIESANIIHNYKYSYEYVDYKNSLSKVTIICKEHGEFKQTPNKHLNGRGCQKCGLKYGKMENNWLDIMNVDKENRQVKIDNYIVDGIDYKNKIIYEFYGDFWHGNPNIFNESMINNVNGLKFSELYRKTLIKEEYLKSKGYKIVSIWESDYITKYK